MSTYFIAVPTGSGNEHMTLKYLGNLSDSEARAWARQLDRLGELEKFPLISEGLGVLGKYKPHLVNFIKKDQRIGRALNMLGNTFESLPPHVTVHGLGRLSPSGGMPVNTGPVGTIGPTVAEEVILYRSNKNGGYQPVHTVKLRKRNPITWIKDMLGINKYAEIEEHLAEKVAAKRLFDIAKFKSLRRPFLTGEKDFNVLQKKIRNANMAVAMNSNPKRKVSLIQAQNARDVADRLENFRDNRIQSIIRKELFNELY